MNDVSHGGVPFTADTLSAGSLEDVAAQLGRTTAGVVHVLRSLFAEADLLMAVDGFPPRKDITPAALRTVA